MSNANQATDLNAENRRSCFRINDRVGLSISVLTDAEFRAARDSAGTRRQRMQVVNALLVESENQKPFLRKLKKRESDLADYLESVEDRLQSLAKALRFESSNAPSKPTHDVNISGSGIRFFHDRRLAKGTRVELDLHLFPSGTCLKLHGTVAWSNASGTRGAERIAVAVDYSDVPEDDRELLIRHVHALQMDYVRRGVRRS